jgi:hypothetical protein
MVVDKTWKMRLFEANPMALFSSRSECPWSRDDRLKTAAENDILPKSVKYMKQTAKTSMGDLDAFPT